MPPDPFYSIIALSGVPRRLVGVTLRVPDIQALFAVPHQYVLDHRAALYERIDKSGVPSIGVFLAADPAARFTDVRGSGGVGFGQFLLS